MENKMQGGALPEKWHRKLFAKKHKYSGLVNWPTLPTRNKPSKRYQVSPHGDSTSCVAQSEASHIEICTGIVASAQPIFHNRSPQTPGMSLSQADNNMFTIGTNTEALIPSQRMTDAELDIPSTQPTPIKGKGKGITVPLNADSIADAINQFGGVKVTFGSNEEEWDSSYLTPIYKGTPIIFYHCILLFDNWKNGNVKTFEAEDSDGDWSSSTGLRHITEDFLLKRATGASYTPGYAVPSPAQPSTVPPDATLVPDPTNTFPLMKPEPKKFWDWFWYFFRGGK